MVDPLSILPAEPALASLLEAGGSDEEATLEADEIEESLDAVELAEEEIDDAVEDALAELPAELEPIDPGLAAPCGLTSLAFGKVQ